MRESNAIEQEHSEEAFEDAKDAWEYAKIFIPEGRKIDIPMILTTHRFLMRRLDSRIAGKLREVDVQVGGRACMPFSAVRNHLEEWCRCWAKKRDEEGIKEAHKLFEKIHPFQDGNGRTGRILMNIQRIKASLPILVIHTGNEQFNYYRWFR